MVKKTFEVTDMSCVVCASNVERTVQALKGVGIAKVNFAANELTVHFDPRIINIQQIKAAVEAAGYGLVTDGDIDEEELRREKYRNHIIRLAAAWATAIAVMSISMTSLGTQATWQWVTAIIATVSLAYCGRRFYERAWQMVKQRSANMDTLVALSTASAWVFSIFQIAFPDFAAKHGMGNHVYFDSATMIVAFVLTGRLLEEKAKNSTSSAIRSLIDLQPSNATVLDDCGGSRLVDIKDIHAGDIVLVKPGGRIPVDGTVSQGDTYVDESMLTGEPMQVAKHKGDKVFAGTINKNGAITVCVTADADTTLLARIVDSVRDAQGSKAPVQRVADVISRYFTYVVVTFAVITLIGWIIAGGSVATAVICAVSVLVIACPCALGLATPTAITVGIGKAAEHHILIKDATALERICKATDIVLDKTGTITEGKPIVVSAKISADATDEDLGVMLAAEKQSEHPLAGVLVASLEDRGITPSNTDKFAAIVGKGVEAHHNGQLYWVGSELMAHERNVKNSDIKANAHGGTTIYFGCGNRLLAVFVLADMVKETSAPAIASLKRLGLRVYMLTGDNNASAARVAEEVGATGFKAEMLPADKEKYILDMQHRGRIVAMAGDGINDSSALARADVSIAMGNGTDIAIETAMVTLPTSDLQMLPRVVRLSKKTMRIVHQNLFWAFIYNIIGLPVAAGLFGVMLDPMWASAAMAVSSVTVVLNSLRLKLVKVK